MIKNILFPLSQAKSAIHLTGVFWPETPLHKFRRPLFGFNVCVFVHHCRTVNNQHDKYVSVESQTGWHLVTLSREAQRCHTTDHTRPHNLTLHLSVTASERSPSSPRRQISEPQRYFRTDSERRDVWLVSCSLSSSVQAESNAFPHAKCKVKVALIQSLSFINFWPFDRRRNRLEFKTKLRSPDWSLYICD